MNMDNSFETKLLEEKTERLGFSLVVVSVLIPVVLVAIGFFGYAELKNSINELNSNKEKSLTRMSSEFENTIFKNASKTEKIESKITDFEDKIKTFSQDILSLDKKISKLDSGIEKQLNPGLDKINKNSLLINSISGSVSNIKNAGDKNSSEIKSISKTLLETQNSIKALSSKTAEFSKTAVSLSKEIELLKTKINSNNALEQIENIYKEIKKREIKERIIEERLDQMEKFLETKNFEHSGFSEKNLIEKDIE
ncbi:MAG: hypothetical protein RBR53_05645 [Desulforegulaceae bacterium]|nr:hypothetical protein [Desulforegulaceae bacterium]